VHCECAPGVARSLSANRLTVATTRPRAAREARFGACRCSRSPPGSSASPAKARAEPRRRGYDVDARRLSRRRLYDLCPGSPKSSAGSISAGRDRLASTFGGAGCAFAFSGLARQFGAELRALFEKRSVLSLPMRPRIEFSGSTTSFCAVGPPRRYIWRDDKEIREKNG
jgi:hypothetical protein